MPLATEPGRMVTYIEQLLVIKSNDLIITRT